MIRRPRILSMQATYSWISLTQLFSNFCLHHIQWRRMSLRSLFQQYISPVVGLLTWWNIQIARKPLDLLNVPLLGTLRKVKGLGFIVRLFWILRGHGTQVDYRSIVLLRKSFRPLFNIYSFFICLILLGRSCNICRLDTFLCRLRRPICVFLS